MRIGVLGQEPGGIPPKARFYYSGELLLGQRTMKRLYTFPYRYHESNVCQKSPECDNAQGRKSSSEGPTRALGVISLSSLGVANVHSTQLSDCGSVGPNSPNHVSTVA